MCGITGYSGKGDRRTLEAMNETLRHRGPDDAGIYLSNPKDANSRDVGANSVGLAQCRLSIIDLSPAGHQPMSNEDGTVWLVFNGEIYNFQELRKELVGRHGFKSQSDTEVIIHIYEEIGTKVFSKIHGMFAVAIYDSKKDVLILARDRMGKKPLYWSVQDEVLMFGSELKALMKHPSFKKEIDPISLNKYLLYEYMPTPATIFKDTYKLEPGTFLVWDGNKVKKEVFWRPTFLPKIESFDASLEALDSELSSAVQSRLVADVPLGIFLSGGLDSSAVAYYASKAHNKVKTFSIGFKEASFDESKYARKVAKHLGTNHYEKILSVNDCLDIIPKIAESLDEPIADASIVPTYLLSKFTSEHVTVALGGDGGDELFCGYDTFLAHRLAGLYEKVPRMIRRMIKVIILNLPTSFSNMSLDFKAKRFVEGFEGESKYRDKRWFAPFNRSDCALLFSGEVWDKVKDRNEFEDIDMHISKSDSSDFYDQLGLIYQRTYMMDQVLVKVDRASMMNSLEVRAPFLDTKVVDLANRMPTSFKFKGLMRKFILKKLMEGKLPKNIIYRKKKGFGIPVGEWIREGLKPLVLDLLGRKSIDRMEFFNADYVEKILQEHFSGKKDNRKQIWTLLIFAMWWRKWMK